MTLPRATRDKIRRRLNLARAHWQQQADQGVAIVTEIVQVQALVQPNGSITSICRNSDLPARVRTLAADPANLREIRVACLVPNPGIPGTLTWGAPLTIWRPTA